jgi:ATP-dependent 26S proteasome regulatory subunit
LRGAVIVFELPYFNQDTTSWDDIVICRQDEVASVMEMVRESSVRLETPLFSTGKGFKSVKSSSWSDLVLDPTIEKLIRRDFESFFAREQWFRNLRLPFRRGYLLHGPPGNGKTSVIRAMLSRPGICGLTLNFFADRIDDDSLEAMFNRAGSCAPSLIVLEDIDRAFPKQQSSGARCAISQQQLLNCLDGIATQDGVVVVATANEPTALDPAILRRPGRFDRVVLFPNPTSELRLGYLHMLNSQLQEFELQAAIDLSEGFSFAQLREAYILAGQMAYEREGEIEPNDILSAVQTLRNGYAMVKQRRDAAGFEQIRTLGLEPGNVLSA